MDPRKILGVNDEASQAEIQRAYREKVKKHHPDMGGDTWAFQQVQDAYEALVNPGKAKPPPQPTRKQTPPATNEPAQRQQTRPTQNPQSTSYRQNKKTVKTSTGNAQKKPKSKPEEQRSIWQLFSGELPLQNETAWFILINCLDIFMTYRLLSVGAIESNPIADYFRRLWGFNGMIAFKLAIVAAVCVIAQIVALKKLNTARTLLLFGTMLVGAVVIYSGWLWVTKFL